MKLHLLLYLVICLFQLPHFLCAQSRVISGTVFSDKIQHGVPGVSVRAGKTIVQTNSKGRYYISALEGDTLVFSRYNFRGKEVIVQGDDTVNVTLSAYNLVVPYGTADEEGFAGSAVLIQPHFWNNRSFTNPLQALQGAGAGIRTTSPSGDPGSGPGVRIRGTSYLESSGSPLYMVDGVEFTGSFSDLNPDDIESITVLKDAVNRSLYGSRGLNGVVMINTRNGAGRKNAFDFSMQMGAATNGVPAYNTVSPAEYYELNWQAYRNSLVYSYQLPVEVAGQIASGVFPRDASGRQVYNNIAYADVVQLMGNYNAFNVPNNALIGLDGKLNPAAVLRNPEELNWIDRVSRTGKRNEYRMAYSRGMGKLDVMTSFNYLREEGWGYRSALERYTGRLNLNYQVTRWFKTGLRVTAARSDSDNASSGSDALDPFYFSRNVGPVYPVHLIDPKTGELVYDNQGNKVYDTGNFTDTYGLYRPFYPSYHAILDNERISDHTDRKLYSGRVFMNFTLLPWLRLDLNAGGDKVESQQKRINNSIRGDGSEFRYKSKNSNYTINQVLTVFKHLGNSEFNFIAGHENLKYNGKDSLETFFLTDPLGPRSLSYFTLEQKWESYFTKINLNLSRRYYLEGTYRKDQRRKYNSSDSWSVGGSWRLDQEGFFNAGWIREMRLYTTYGRSAGMYSPPLFLFPNTVQYPFAAGVSFSMLKDRLQGALEYYSTTVEGPVRATVYWSSTLEALTGKQKNSGLELSLTSVLAEGKRFFWSVSSNLTLQNDVLTKMPAQIPELPDGNFRLRKGVSRYAYYTRSFWGVDPESGLPLYRGVENYDPANPAIKILETAGRRDTVTSDFRIARQMFVGKSALPKGYGSIINWLRYGNFDLNLLITYQFGGWIMDNRYMSPGSLGANLHKDLLHAWQQPGDITDIPRMDLSRAADFMVPSTRWLVRSDYMSLAGVNLGYRIPEKALPFMKVTVFVNAENVYFLTRRKGLNTLSFFEYSADSYTYNFARKFNMGLNVKL